MPRKYIRRKYRRVPKKVAVARKAKNLSSSRAFRVAVQKVVSRVAESKLAFHSITAVNYNSGINVTGDAPRVLPSITQGTGDSNRIGDQLKSQSLTVKGAIVYNPSTGQYGTYANARLGVRMMIVQPRNFSNIDDVQSNAAAWMALLLKKGSSTAAFTGVLSDLWAPINSDFIIKYYDKVFYLDAPYQQTAVGSTLMGRSTKMFSIKLKTRNKILRYDQNVSSGASPTNYAPVLLLGYAHMDGSSPDTLTTAVQLSYDSVFTYEDA